MRQTVRVGLGKLVAELAEVRLAAEEGRLRERRGHDRLRAPGASPDHDLVFVDRVIVTLVVLRFQLPHAALAVFHGVDCSTITPAVREVRPLLVARGFAIWGHPDLREARQRRTQTVADPPALPRAPRRLRRDLPCRGRTGLRSRSRKVITQQTIGQADTSRPQSGTTS
jgi:hypothetical protein